MWSLVNLSQIVSSNNKCFCNWKKCQSVEKTNLGEIDFTSGLQLETVLEFEKLKEIFIITFQFDNPKNIYEVAFTPTKISKKNENPIELLSYKNHHWLSKNWQTFVGPPKATHLCRNCWTAFPAENQLIFTKASA